MAFDDYYGAHGNIPQFLIRLKAARLGEADSNLLVTQVVGLFRGIASGNV
jgi:hypothetical protein